MINQHFKSRHWAIFITSFASGLPLLLVTSTLQAWLSSVHIGLYWIGLTSYCALPYALKFLWAPALDYYLPLKSFDQRKSWLVIIQLLLAAFLFLLAYVEPKSHYQLFLWLVFFIAFFSASQDIVVDAYRTEVATASERGTAATLLMVGYRFAMLIAGALSLIIAAKFGWKLTYTLMAITFLILAFNSMMVPNSGKVERKESVFFLETVRLAWQELFTRYQVLLLMSFIVFYKLTDDLIMVMMTPFLIQHLKFSLTVVGSVSKTVGLLAVIMGGLYGQYGLKKLGLFRALMLFGALQFFAALGFALLAILGKNMLGMTIILFLENFSVGLVTVVFVAFLMGLCHRSYTASQYAILSAIMSLPRVLLGPVSASLVLHLGWFQFFIFAAFVGLPGLIFLLMLNRKRVGPFAYD